MRFHHHHGRRPISVVATSFFYTHSVSSLLSQRPVSSSNSRAFVRIVVCSSVPVTVRSQYSPAPLVTPVPDVLYQQIILFPSSLFSVLFPLSMGLDVLNESATCLGGFYITSRASRSAAPLLQHWILIPPTPSAFINSCSQCKIRPRLCFSSIIISSRRAIFGLCVHVFCSHHRSPIFVTVPLFSLLFPRIPSPLPLSRICHHYPVISFPSLFSHSHYHSPVPVIVLPFSSPFSRSHHCRYSPVPVVIIPIIVHFTSVFVIVLRSSISLSPEYFIVSGLHRQSKCF